MLRIEGMNAHYGASHVLQGVDLDMPQGRISAVLGRNGVPVYVLYPPGRPPVVLSEILSVDEVRAALAAL